MSFSPGVASLENRKQVLSEVKDLSELSRSLKPQLDHVCTLISERVFQEENFAELLLSTGARAEWEKKILPDWLMKIIGSDGVPFSSPAHEMARHLMSRSGKLFRATLVLYSVRAMSPDEDRGT